MIEYCLIICVEMIFELEIGWWMFYWLWLCRRNELKYYFMNRYLLSLVSVCDVFWRYYWIINWFWFKTYTRFLCAPQIRPSQNFQWNGRIWGKNNFFPQIRPPKNPKFVLSKYLAIEAELDALVWRNRIIMFELTLCSTGIEIE